MLGVEPTLGAGRMCALFTELLARWLHHLRGYRTISGENGRYYIFRRRRGWYQLVTQPPIGERSTMTSVSVCLCVCLCVCLSVRDHIFVTTRPIFTKFCVTYGRGSVLFWRRYVLPVSQITSHLLISQGCSTSPLSWSAVHTQPWAWL